MEMTLSDGMATDGEGALLREEEAEGELKEEEEEEGPLQVRWRQ